MSKKSNNKKKTEQKLKKETLQIFHKLYAMPRVFVGFVFLLAFQYSRITNSCRWSRSG